MTRRRLWTLGTILVAACGSVASFAGCELVVGTGDLTESGSDAGQDSTAGSDAQPGVDAPQPGGDAGTDAPRSATDTGPIAFDADVDCAVDGSHVCSGSCVPNDINHCGPTCQTCNPNPQNGTSTCDGTKCTITCDTDYADCADSGLGCASYLYGSQSCGSCGNDCAGNPAGPTCGVKGSVTSGECSCVSLGDCANSPHGHACVNNQCGCTAGSDCPTLANGTFAACTSATCVTACMAGWTSACPIVDGSTTTQVCGCGAPTVGACVVCAAGEGCRDGGCTACGASGQPCCEGNTCPNSGTQTCNADAGICQ